MSYKSTVSIIRDVSNLVNSNGSFIHGRRIDASNKYDGKFPLIVLYPFMITKGVDPDFIDSSSILMGFYMQDDVASSPEERETIIELMDILSDNFLGELASYKLSRIQGLVKEPLYQFHQGTVSGMAIRFTFFDFTPC